MCVYVHYTQHTCALCITICSMYAYRACRRDTRGRRYWAFRCSISLSMKYVTVGIFFVCSCCCVSWVCFAVVIVIAARVRGLRRADLHELGRYGTNTHTDTHQQHGSVFTVYLQSVGGCLHHPQKEIAVLLRYLYTIYKIESNLPS